MFVPLRFAARESSCIQALMSPGGGRQMHGQSAPGKAKQRRREDGPTYGSYLYSSTAFGACREGLRRILW